MTYVTTFENKNVFRDRLWSCIRMCLLPRVLHHLDFHSARPSGQAVSVCLCVFVCPLGTFVYLLDL